VKSIVNTFHTAFTTPAYTGLLWLAIRIFVAYEFISAGLEKWESGKWLGVGTGGAIAGFLKGGLAKATGAHPEVQPWYTDLTKNVFLPNADLFANLVAIGEVFVGTALLIGIFTRFAALCGATMNLAFLAAGTSSSNPQMLLFQVAILFGGAGVTYYAVDHFLMPYLGKVTTKAFKLDTQTTETGPGARQLKPAHGAAR